jgi:hypothetical protein
VQRTEQQQQQQQQLVQACSSRLTPLLQQRKVQAAWRGMRAHRHLGVLQRVVQKAAAASAEVDPVLLLVLLLLVAAASRLRGARRLAVQQPLLVVQQQSSSSSSSRLLPRQRSAVRMIWVCLQLAGSASAKRTACMRTMSQALMLLLQQQQQRRRQLRLLKYRHQQLNHPSSSSSCRGMSAVVPAGIMRGVLQRLLLLLGQVQQQREGRVGRKKRGACTACACWHMSRTRSSHVTHAATGTTSGAYS